MKQILVVVCILVMTVGAAGQSLTQTVRGVVVDGHNDAPLEGASIRISGVGNAVFVARASADGAFALEVPLGRYKLEVTYTGYRAVEEEVMVIAARELVRHIRMQLAVAMLETIEISGAGVPEELPGMRTLTIEKTLRVPANFFDPVRVATAWPGVMATNDQNNAIIVRGNSPNGLLWRLNGLDVVNPNHQANAGTLSDKPLTNGGGVNILSAQMLERTDFYTGALPVQYGNVLSGAVDMKLRPGNTRNYAYTAQASLIGIDLAAEGPIGKKKSTSFLANYRYSTVGLLAAAGISFGDEDIRFQDFSFHINHAASRGALVSFFGFWGNGSNEFNAKPAADWEEDKDRYDIDFGSENYTAGVTVDRPLGKGKLSVGSAWSMADQSRLATASPEFPENGILRDSLTQRNQMVSSRVLYQFPLNASVVGKVGAMINYTDNALTSVKNLGCHPCGFPNAVRTRQGNTVGWLMQPFAGVEATVSRFLLQAGMRYVYFSFNATSAVEPRISSTYALSARSSLTAAYNLTSQIHSPQVYGAPNNRNLEMTKSHRFDLSYGHEFQDGLMLKSSLYMHRLFDVPVADNPATFSALNLLEEPAPSNLVNDGTGVNYGIDASAEKLFFDRHYFMVNGSYYESKYLVGEEQRDTRFNGNYTFAAVYGTEWTNTEKERVVSLSARVLWLGGLPTLTVDEESSVSISETVYDYSDFQVRMADYYRADLRLSFQKNKRGYTRTFAIDIQNVTNRENQGYPFFDFFRDEVVTKKQLGIIPVLLYRIDF